MTIYPYTSITTSLEALIDAHLTQDTQHTATQPDRAAAHRMAAFHPLLAWDDLTTLDASHDPATLADRERLAALIRPDAVPVA